MTKRAPPHLPARKSHGLDGDPSLPDSQMQRMLLERPPVAAPGKCSCLLPGLQGPEPPGLVARLLVPHHPVVDTCHFHTPEGLVTLSRSPQSGGREKQLSDEAHGAEA